MNDRTTPPAPGPAAPDRTVLASADQLAAALGGASAAPVPPPFPGPPPPAVQVFAGGLGGPDALIGVQLNDLFEVTRFIAEGGMGRVYEGRNIASGERVAIKVILGQYAADEQFMALFRREASALERIGHDALVKYRALAFDRARGINYLVIEYVDGPSMAAVLSGEPADPALARRVLRRMALGLQAAHDAGVIHRDLSPDNVLLPDGNVERCKIIDFGIAKDTNPGEKSVVGEAFAGKFGYAAPEIFGKYGRRIGPWTDIYSLALVVAAYARGAAVDMGVTIVDALDARAHVPDLAGVGAELRPVLEKMLAPDPADRFQTMEEVADAVDPRGGGSHLNNPALAAAAAAAATVAEAPPVPAFIRAEPPASPTVADGPKPRRAPLLAAGAAALLALAGVGGWLATRDGPPAAPPAAEAAEEASGQADAQADALEAAADRVEPVAGTPAAPPWPQARAAVAAALAALPCADVRIDGAPAEGRVRLAGWRASGTALPASAGGWSLDGGGVQPVAAPSAETCRLIDALRRAAPTNPERGFALPGMRSVPLGDLPRNAAGDVVLIDLQVRDRPPGRALFTSIDDRPADPSQRVASGDAEDAQLDFAAVDFEPKATRYLFAVLAAPTKLPAVTAAGPPAAIARACAGGGCRLATGWLDVTP